LAGEDTPAPSGGNTLGSSWPSGSPADASGAFRPGPRASTKAVTLFFQTAKLIPFLRFLEGRGDSAAFHGTTRRWSFHGLGRGRRPSASPCGNPMDSKRKAWFPAGASENCAAVPAPNLSFFSPKKSKVKGQGREAGENAGKKGVAERQVLIYFNIRGVSRGLSRLWR
jgi:hypothetical protein